MTATAADELLALKRGLAKARERAARNGLSLELNDQAIGSAWPGKRMASAHLMEGRKQVASFAQSYGGSRKDAALSICLERVFSVPTTVEEIPDGRRETRPDRTALQQARRDRGA